MRTTLTLDPDVVRLLEDEVHRTRRPFKQVVNEAIRHGLAPAARAITTPYKVKAHITKLAPGIDPTKFNGLVDELEDEAILAKVGRATRAAERKR
ncbi:MAG: antitoxin [Kofleriaceae bacterium]